MEEWRDIKGYEGLYQVSDLGRVKSLNYNKTGEERLMKPYKISKKSENTYYLIQLHKDGKKYRKRVHRLVAEAFIPNPNGLPDINHKDENGLNNRVDNLEWCNAKYNNNYGTRIQRVSEKLSKTVCQYSLDGKLIKVWPSTREIERQTGFAQTNISACCNGKHSKAYGFIWKYQIPLNVPV